MPDMWMDVDAILTEIPVNLLSLIDDTDFKTREEAVAWNQAGMDLQWNFTTTAGATTQTVVTPTTGGGDYDWAIQGNGLYTIGMPAAAGASANNDTEGFGWFTGYATGVLPWRGPTIGFRAAALNNALIDGGDYLTVDAMQVEGGDATDAITAAVTASIVTHNLDHLALTATAGADMTTEVADNTILSRILAAGNTSDFNPTTDGLQPVRDQGDAAWITAVGFSTHTAADVVDDFETQSQLDPTGFHVNTMEIESADATDTLEAATTASLVAHNLDHLALTATAGADMTTEVADNTILGRILANGDTSDFDPATDGLQPIRDQGDAAWITAAGFSTLTAADVNAEVDTALNTAIPGAPTADSINERIATLDNAYTAARAAFLDELAAANLPTDVANIAIALAALNNVSVADINTQMLDVLVTDTFAQPGQETPAATQSLKNMMAYLYKFMRNRVIARAAGIEVYNDDAVTIDQKATHSDAAGVYDRGEFVSGP